MSVSARVALALAVVFAAPTLAHAHPLNTALLDVRETDAGAYDVLWKAPAGTDAPDASTGPTFPAHCKTSARRAQRVGAFVLERWHLDCRPHGLAGERIAIPNRSATSPEIIARLTLAHSRNAVVLLAPTMSTFRVPTKQSTADVAWRYTELGIEHILTGFDHLLFVLGLTLLVRNRWNLLKTITAFTLGHSVTLALATLGVVHLPSQPIEASIALSILLLAVELSRPPDAPATITARFPWLIAATFGLLHGFGFAGALREVGLPEGDVPLALATFNIGVELGQLVFLTAVLLLRAAFAGWSPRILAPAQRLSVYALGICAAYWCTERIVSFWH